MKDIAKSVSTSFLGYYDRKALSSQSFTVPQRLSTPAERCNYLNDAYKLEGAHRNASYGLIRLILANICEHAVIRYLEALKTASNEELLQQTLIRRCGIYREQYLDTG